MKPLLLAALLLSGCFLLNTTDRDCDGMADGFERCSGWTDAGTQVCGEARR